MDLTITATATDAAGRIATASLSVIVNELASGKAPDGIFSWDINQTGWGFDPLRTRGDL